MDILGMFSSIGGHILSHYEVGVEIGSGAMGAVYSGRDVRLGRPVAIKVLPHWSRGDPEARKRLICEARSASTLNHPNIVTIYDIAQYKGVDLIVMEHVKGKPLNHLIPKRGFPVRPTLRLAIQIADALYAAHSAGIIHRDLKPSNIMVSDNGWVKLLDFGLAVPLSGHQKGIDAQRKGGQPGTKSYMSPEQLRGFAGDVRSEIFSFGIVFYQMLSGRHPFAAATTAQIARNIATKNVPELPPKVPTNVSSVVYRCLRKRPEQRFPSMDETLKALQNSSAFLQANRLLPSRSNPVSHARTEIPQIRAITKRIDYKNTMQSRRALLELSKLLELNISAASRETVVASLKQIVLNLDDYAGFGVPDRVREVRKLVIEVMKAAAQGDLRSQFQNNELELLDLFGMNFAGCHLSGVSFRKCLLAESDFRRCKLVGASFAGAYIRNVNFEGADLSGADFTDSDWFNGLGLTENQLKRIRPGTLRNCPTDVAGMHQILDVRYRIPFQSWPWHVQEQLRRAWAIYLQPGGLRDIVARSSS